MSDPQHALIVNLVRVGLPLHVADQAIAEIEDSLWLARRLEAHEGAVRGQCADEIERVSHETYGVVLAEHAEAAGWLREVTR